MGLRGPKTQSREQRIASFNKRVDKSGDCWIWLGPLSESGYGKFNCLDGKRNWRAHRASWTIAYGPIPDGMLVLHKCDNRRCVRPEHLFLGNNKDNTQDALQKGRLKDMGPWRHPCPGELNGRAKINLTDVQEIRDMANKGTLQRDISRKFGIGQTAVSKIVNNQTWKHVTGE